MNSHAIQMPEETAEGYTLGGRVYHRIREAILNGTYKPDEELREIAIGKALGVSRTPVREALRQLELEGLVYIIPNKGAYVKGITAEDVRDIYMIRSRLEGLSARLAAEKITPQQLADLEEVIYLAEYHAANGHYEKVFEMDSKFHELLYEACGSRQLHHLLSDYHHYVQQVRKLSVTKEVRAGQSTHELLMILEAIRERDTDKAEELARAHVANTIHSIQMSGIDMDEEELLNGKN